MLVKGTLPLDAGEGTIFGPDVVRDLIGKTFNNRTVVSAEQISPSRIWIVVEFEVDDGFDFPFISYAKELNNAEEPKG